MANDRPRHQQRSAIPNPYQDANRIRKAVLSEKGPSQASTRGVLLALLQFGGHSQVVYPSQKTLSVMTGLSLRSIRIHLKLAQREGWITTESKGSKRGKWPHHTYLIHTPDEAAEFAAINERYGKTAESAQQLAETAD